MSTEQRDVRAIGVVHALQALLSEGALYIGEKGYTLDDRVIIDEITYVHAQMAVSLGGVEKVTAALTAAQSELASLDLEADHLEFAVILSSGFLRILEFRHRMPLSQLPTFGDLLVLTEGERPDALLAWRSGCTVELSVHLSVERPRQPLKPWRVGSWVARASWGIATEAGFTGFTPKPLTPARKKEFGLSPKTMRYITFGGTAVLEQGVSEESVELWLDADLLAKLSANPRTKAAVALQRQLFVDAVSAVVNGALVAEDFDMLTWLDVRDTLVGRVISLATLNHSSELARDHASAGLLEMMKKDPGVFMSYIEEAATLLGAYDAGLDG